MVLRSRMAVLPAAAVLVLAACGGESDEEQIESTARSFFAAVEEEDAEAFCDAIVFTGPGRCEDVIEVSGFQSNGDLDDLQVTDVEVDGDTATAELRATSEDGTEMTQDAEFRRIAGEWKIEFE